MRVRAIDHPTTPPPRTITPTQNKTTQHLILRGRAIKEEWGKGLAKEAASFLGVGLAVNTGLVSLDVTGMGIGDAGAVALAEALRKYVGVCFWGLCLFECDRTSVPRLDNTNIHQQKSHHPNTPGHPQNQPRKQEPHPPAALPRRQRAQLRGGPRAAPGAGPQHAAARPPLPAGGRGQGLCVRWKKKR